ncbi:uncharacterized protein [Nicotiana tomentosiformis]|uniref:uncharacterized protein n=1 Tax=Nicotiana tomentosiformis TaxID=4098 RepID=UPI00388C42F3
MAKTSKTLPLEEKASSSQPAGDKTPVEPRIEECIPEPCELTSDFKVEKPSSFPAGFLVQSRTLQVGFDNWPWKPIKDKKRRKASPPDTPKPKKSRARKSKTDLAVLPADVVQTLRDEDEEGKDVDCLLVARNREGIEVLRTAEPATVLHREASSKYWAELARCEADLKKLMKERDTLKLLYVQKEEEIMSIRAELARGHQDQTELIEQQKAELVEQLREEAKMKEAETLGWKHIMDRLASEKDDVRAQLSSIERQLQSVKGENLARAQKVEELETRLAAELARATSEAKVLVASYRADAEAANTRAKEISDATEVRLSRVADHARRQSRKETLEEIHARGFDLTTDIKSAKVLEDEAVALLSDDEDSASGYESDGDEDEAPEMRLPMWTRHLGFFFCIRPCVVFVSTLNI